MNCGRIAPLVASSMFLASLASAQSTTRVPGPPDEDALRAAADYLESCNGHAMLVYHGDELIFEEYFNGWRANRAHRLASGTKSFSGAMAVAAVEDELLDFDEKVSDTITEWQGDGLKARITVRQLLSLTSGLDPGENLLIPTYAEAVQVDALSRAGRRFRYGPSAFQIFGELMRRKLADRGEDPLDYLERRIFKPIGLEYRIWRRDADGNPHLPSGAFLTAREWAKFGLLIRDGGEWNGEQVLDADILKQCFNGSQANASYGLTFWLNATGSGPADLVMAAGLGKQKLYIIPSRDLLIVQFAEARGYREREFLRLVLGDNHSADPE